MYAMISSPIGRNRKRFPSSFPKGLFPFSGTGAIMQLRNPEVPLVEPTTDLTKEGDVHYTHQAVTDHRLDRTPSILRKRSRSSDIMGAINAMVEHVKACLDLFTTSHTSSASPSPSSVRTGSYSITQCLAVLNTIPGLDKVTYIKTMNHLTNNAEWRELFMGLDEEKKLWAIESIP
ncbi:hypothetical protein NE237_026117 [Protea cynaroides]|uniref:Uncharacterized protein n=1 Tax=Protea cynaroides TaxID=273540 RepID=A0A9Q0H5I9_9MAGN|nr:hypothetical protein NE237_026117 [Protea cynaroides]